MQTTLAPPDLSPRTAEALARPAGRSTRLAATPGTVRWGAIDPGRAPVLEVASGDRVTIEAISHHAGDAPELMMDDAMREVWAAIPEAERAPGVHVLTGPVAVAGARAGGAVAVTIESMSPRFPYGSNCAANWGLLHDRFGKERITIYRLDEAPAGEFPATAQPVFGYDFTSRALYDVPGWLTPAEARQEQPPSRAVRVPVRPHLGLLSVAPPGSEVLSSIPPGAFGGNVDNWRIGPGATAFYPVFHDGGLVSVGDPHFAQGDGEVCGTAIEASADVTMRLTSVDDLQLRTPVLETVTHWYTHGFGTDLDAAARMAVEEMITLLQWRGGLSADDAYSLASVAADMGVTQVVDGTIGAHCGIARSILA